jgi:acyl carrier protein
MTFDGAGRAKSMIASILETRLLEQGIAPTQLSDDFDLRQQGIIDSFGFIQLIAELEARLGHPVDLTEIPPEQLTQVGALARCLSARHHSS